MESDQDEPIQINGLEEEEVQPIPPEIIDNSKKPDPKPSNFFTVEEDHIDAKSFWQQHKLKIVGIAIVVLLLILMNQIYVMGAYNSCKNTGGTLTEDYVCYFENAPKNPYKQSSPLDNINLMTNADLTSIKCCNSNKCGVQTRYSSEDDLCHLELCEKVNPNVSQCVYPSTNGS